LVCWVGGTLCRSALKMGLRTRRREAVSGLGDEGGAEKEDEGRTHLVSCQRISRALHFIAVGPRWLCELSQRGQGG